MKNIFKLFSDDLIVRRRTMEITILKLGTPYFGVFEDGVCGDPSFILHLYKFPSVQEAYDWFIAGHKYAIDCEKVYEGRFDKFDFDSLNVNKE